jgi:hypothetical protein
VQWFSTSRFTVRRFGISRSQCGGSAYLSMFRSFCKCRGHSGHNSKVHDLQFILQRSATSSSYCRCKGYPGHNLGVSTKLPTICSPWNSSLECIVRMGVGGGGAHLCPVLYTIHTSNYLASHSTVHAIVFILLYTLHMDEFRCGNKAER